MHAEATPGLVRLLDLAGVLARARGADAVEVEDVLGAAETLAAGTYEPVPWFRGGTDGEASEALHRAAAATVRRGESALTVSAYLGELGVDADVTAAAAERLLRSLVDDPPDQVHRRARLVGV